MNKVMTQCSSLCHKESIAYVDDALIHSFIFVRILGFVGVKRYWGVDGGVVVA